MLRKESHQKGFSDIRLDRMFENWIDLQKCFGDEVGINQQIALSNAVSGIGREFVGVQHSDIEEGIFEKSEYELETEFYLAAAYLYGMGTSQDISRGETLLENVAYKADETKIGYARMCAKCFETGKVQLEGEEAVIEINQRNDLDSYCCEKLERLELILKIFYADKVED